jgi:hypothetical protein
MSKVNLTLADLNNALTPIIESLKGMRESQEISNAQLSETYNMVVNISVKLDTFDQKVGLPVESPKKVSCKKTSQKVSCKTNTTKLNDDESETDLDSSSQKNMKRLPLKKGSNQDEHEINDESNDEEDNEKDTTTKKPVKKVIVKKTRNKKPVVPKKERSLNKMEYFNKMFDNDDTYFDSYITNKNKNTIAENHDEKWNNVSDDQLRKLKRTAYYHFMKDTHDDKLQAMKQSYIDDLKNQKLVIVEKEDE